MPGQLVSAARVMQSRKRDGAAMRPRPAHDHEARLVLRHLQMPTNGRVRQLRAHDLLSLLQRSDRGQVGTGRDGAEVLLGTFGSEFCKNVAVFHLYRRAVLEMHQQHVKYVGALLDVESLCDLTARMLPRVAQHIAGMVVAPLRNLVGDVVHFEHVRPGAKVGDEGAATGDALDVTLIGKFTERTIRRHPRYAHALDELVLRWHPIVRAELPGRDLRDDQVLELLVTRLPAVTHRFAPTAATASRNVSRAAAPDRCSPSATSHSPCTITPSIGSR
jgi:hypothetical protein